MTQVEIPELVEELRARAEDAKATRYWQQGEEVAEALSRLLMRAADALSSTAATGEAADANARAKERQRLHDRAEKAEAALAAAERDATERTLDRVLTEIQNRYETIAKAQTNLWNEAETEAAKADTLFQVISEITSWRHPKINSSAG